MNFQLLFQLYFGASVAFASSTEPEFVIREHVHKNWIERLLQAIYPNNGLSHREYVGRFECDQTQNVPTENIDLLESTLDAFFRYEYSAVYAKNPVFKRLYLGQKILVYKKALHQIRDEDTFKNVVTVFPNNKVCFGPYELLHRLPSNSHYRRRYLEIVNSFITFLNFRNDLKVKIASVNTNI